MKSWYTPLVHKYENFPELTRSFCSRLGHCCTFKHPYHACFFIRCVSTMFEGVFPTELVDLQRLQFLRVKEGNKLGETLLPAVVAQAWAFLATLSPFTG